MRDEKFVPIDLALVGIVDQLEVKPDGSFDYALRAGESVHMSIRHYPEEKRAVWHDTWIVGKCNEEHKGLE